MLKNKENADRVGKDKSFKDDAKKISNSFKDAGGIEEAVAFIEQVGGANT